MTSTKMMSIGQVCKNASRRFVPPRDGKVWFINTGDVENGYFIHNNISDWDGLPGQAKKAISVNDILYSEIRPGNGRYAYVGSEYPNAVVSTKFMVLESYKCIRPKYLYHVLTSEQIQSEMKLIAESRSGTFPQITFESIAHLELPVPSVEEQDEICELLDSIEGRINVNQKMNQTFEDIGKAIFKSWFVDFDPVRAKAEGRSTGLPAEISDLFPDAFEDSEIGEIPAGWNECRFSDCEIEIESGRRPKGGIDKSLSEGIPSIGAESVAPAGIFDFSKVKYVTEEFAAKMKRGKVQNFDVALYKDGGRPGQFIPRIGVYGDEFPFSECYVNEHVFLLRSRYLGQPFLYRMVSSDDFLHQLIAKGSAKAAQPGLNQEEVASNKLIVPSDPLLRVFNEMSEAPLKRQFLLGKEIKVLSELRDTLLPKLISGELRIPDAEKFLEEAGI